MSFKDFEDDNGNVDWDAYHAHEVATGNRCMNRLCGAYILNLGLFGKRCEGPQQCGSCRSFDQDENEEVSHDTLLRCPKCKAKSAASEEWEGGIYDENEKTHIHCGECDHEFEVETSVSYSFTSPPIVVEN